MTGVIVINSWATDAEGWQDIDLGVCGFKIKVNIPPLNSGCSPTATIVTPAGRWEITDKGNAYFSKKVQDVFSTLAVFVKKETESVNDIEILQSENMVVGLTVRKLGGFVHPVFVKRAFPGEFPARCVKEGKE